MIFFSFCCFNITLSSTLFIKISNFFIHGALFLRTFALLLRYHFATGAHNVLWPRSKPSSVANDFDCCHSLNSVSTHELLWKILHCSSLLLRSVVSSFVVKSAYSSVCRRCYRSGADISHSYPIRCSCVDSNYNSSNLKVLNYLFM